MSRNKLPPTISNISVTPAAGPGGTIFTASVTASGQPPLRIHYQWHLDGAPISGATGSSHIASDAGSLAVRVTATNREGSDTRESALVLVTPALAAPVVTEASVKPLTGAVGDTFTAIAAATGVPVPDIAYQWLLGGIAIPGATAATYAAVAEGELSVRITASNSEGSDSLDSVAASVGAALAAPSLLEVAIAPASGRIGDTFSVTMRATGNPQPDVDVQWLLDGVILPGATEASCTPNSPGALSARVIATNSEGSAMRESAPVTVEPALGVPPEVSAVEVLPSSGRVGDTFSAEVVLTGKPAPAIAFQWLLDGAEIAGAVAQSHAPASAGQLAVQVTASNDLGSASARSAVVPVEPALAAPTIDSAEILPARGQVGEAFTIFASTAGVPEPELSYQWFLDGQPLLDATNATCSAAAPGALSARVTAVNSEGSVSLDINAVIVEPALEAPTVWEISISPAAGRVGDTFSAVATVSGNPEPTLAYQWKLDGLAVEGANESAFNPKGGGALSVRVTASNSLGSATALSDIIALEPALAAPRIKSADILPNVGRVGDTFTVHAKVCGVPEPEVSYAWILDNRIIHGVTDANFTALEQGTLYVRLLARNSEGEDQRESGAVEVEAALAEPTISNVTIIPGSGQVGDTFSLSAVVSGNPAPLLQFQWNLDGLDIPGADGAEFAPAASGDLTVQVTASNIAGVRVQRSPPVSVIFEPNTTVFQGEIFEAEVFD